MKCNNPVMWSFQEFCSSILLGECRTIHFLPSRREEQPTGPSDAQESGEKVRDVGSERKRAETRLATLRERITAADRLLLTSALKNVDETLQDALIDLLVQLDPASRAAMMDLLAHLRPEEVWAAVSVGGKIAALPPGVSQSLLGGMEEVLANYPAARFFEALPPDEQRFIRRFMEVAEHYVERQEGGITVERQKAQRILAEYASNPTRHHAKELAIAKLQMIGVDVGELKDTLGVPPPGVESLTMYRGSPMSRFRYQLLGLDMAWNIEVAERKFQSEALKSHAGVQVKSTDIVDGELKRTLKTFNDSHILSVRILSKREREFGVLPDTRPGAERTQVLEIAVKGSANPGTVERLEAIRTALLRPGVLTAEPMGAERRRRLIVDPDSGKLFIQRISRAEALRIITTLSSLGSQLAG